jgi:hypothetical protein
MVFVATFLCVSYFLMPTLVVFKKNSQALDSSYLQIKI